MSNLTSSGDGSLDFVITIVADKSFDNTQFDITADVGSHTDSQSIDVGVYELPDVQATLLVTELHENENSTEILECSISGSTILC